MRPILIIGGTGTLGRALVSKLYGKYEITVFSRDENKQKALVREYPDVRCVVGDVCNRSDFKRLKFDVVFKYVFHCAAMKHIEICEDYVEKCVDTNYLGTINAYEETIFQRFVFFSTDKAVAPINAYGHSKALAEKWLANKIDAITFRWGNIIGSTGSFIPNILSAVYAGKPITITDEDMTRFWIHIEEAVEFVIKNMGKRDVEGALFPPMKAASIKVLIEAIKIATGENLKIEYVGTRPGERKHEYMINDYISLRHSSADFVVSAKELALYMRGWIEAWKTKNIK